MYFKPMPLVTIEYQLGQINSKGEERPSEVIGGDITTTIDAINEARSRNYTHPEAHFALRDEVDLDAPEKRKIEQELMNEFERTWLPDVPTGNLQFAWIRHNPTIVNKRTKQVHNPFELNFSAVQILGGKPFCFYVHNVDKPLRSAFINWWHVTHPQFTHPDCSPRYFSSAKTWSDAEHDVYERANDAVAKAAKKGKIKSIDDVVSTLQQNGMEVERHKTYLSIKDDSTDRNIRLKGRIFAKDFDFRKVLEPRSLNEVLPLSTEEYRTILDCEIAKRKERLLRRYPILYNNNYDYEKNRNNKQSVVVINAGKGPRITGAGTRHVAGNIPIEGGERRDSRSGSTGNDRNGRPVLQEYLRAASNVVTGETDQDDRDPLDQIFGRAETIAREDRFRFSQYIQSIIRSIAKVIKRIGHRINREGGDYER